MFFSSFKGNGSIISRLSWTIINQASNFMPFHISTNNNRIAYEQWIIQINSCFTSEID
jgi:hypothetical protein